MTAVVFPRGQRVEIVNDAEGRPTEIRRPGLCEYKFGYDDGGRLSAVHYPDGSRQSFAFDAQGRLLRASNRNSHVTEYRRDDKGSLQAIVDPLHRETTFDLDEGGDLRGVRFADETSEGFGYDPDLRVAVHTRRDGSDVVHVLGTEGNLEGVVWPQSAAAYETDAKGYPTAIRSDCSTVQFNCNDEGDVLVEGDEQQEVQFEYDPDGRPIVIRSPAGEIRYTYNDDGYLAEIIDWSGARHQIESGPEGELFGIRYANGLTEQRTPAAIGIFERAAVTDAVGKVLSEQVYEWDSCERLVRWEDLPTEDNPQRRAVSFSHDFEGHILEERDAGTERPLARYAYDAAGNMVRDGDIVVRFGPMDQPIDYGGQVVRYDGLGQMVHLPGTRGPIDCEFSDNGVLRKATCDSRSWHYEYDGLGRRTRKTDGVHEWRYGWAGVQLLWEEYRHPSSEPIRRDYLLFPDGILPFAFRENGRIYTMQTDARGAVIRVFDDQGAVVWRATYDSFGNAQIMVERIRQPLRLAGHYYDDETGLHYNSARYFSPLIKSYLSRDPEWHNPTATNYSYARNDPWNRMDPHGTIAPLIGVLVIGGMLLGAAIGYAVERWRGEEGDVLAGVVGGAIAGAGMFLGPVGIGTAAAGAFVESLIRRRHEDKVCIRCALGAAAAAATLAIVIPAGLSRLGRFARPYLSKLGAAVARRLGPMAQRLLSYLPSEVADTLAGAKSLIGKTASKIGEALKEGEEAGKRAVGWARAKMGNAATNAANKIRAFLYPYPKPTAASDAAAARVEQAMKEVGMGSAPRAFGVLTHEDGSVTVALSGSPEEVAKQQARLAKVLPENFRFAPAKADTSNHASVTFTNGRVGVSDSCVEPRLFEGAANNSKKSKIEGMTITNRGKVNKYPSARGGNDMSPCDACNRNRRLIMNPEKKK